MVLAVKFLSISRSSVVNALNGFSFSASSNPPSLKGDLGLRPIYHPKPERIEAPLFVAFLAYGLSITLRQRLKALAGGLMPRGVFEKLASLQLLDGRVPATDGRERLRVRRTEPARDAALLLARLNLELPPQPPPATQPGPGGLRTSRGSGDVWRPAPQNPNQIPLPDPPPPQKRKSG